MWIQSQERFDCVAEFDDEKGTLREYSRQFLAAQAPKIAETDGWFSHIRGGVLILYRKTGNIFFRVNDNEFVLDKGTEVEVFGPREKRKLVLKRNAQVVFDIEYELLQEPPIPNDPTPFIEEEDFDFGVFVSNISKDPKRKAVFLGKD